MFVGVDGDCAESHVAILQRGLAKIHGDDLVLVGARTCEFGFIRVHLVCHR